MEASQAGTNRECLDIIQLAAGGPAASITERTPPPPSAPTTTTTKYHVYEGRRMCVDWPACFRFLTVVVGH